ncbi:MAG: hypothetical protein M0T77_11560 [Actinomycetota bacterium]|nr:hypothetical protein [Actinomycetota bacterium]
MDPRRLSDLTASVAACAAALGVCLIGASVMTPLASAGIIAWVVAGVGLGVLAAGLAILWVWQVRRDQFPQ